MHALRVHTLPGVRYTLQQSPDLAPGSWANVESLYGSGVEWILPLFPASPPATPASPQTPVLPPSTAEPLRAAFLILERSTIGTVVASWLSLDDGKPIRQELSNFTLDPVWLEPRPYYLYPHGHHFFCLSPRFGTDIDFTADPLAAPPGPLDTAMLADFVAKFPEMTANLKNGIASAAHFSAPVPSSSARRFYRIHADYGYDAGGDGIPDWTQFAEASVQNPFASSSGGSGPASIPDKDQDGLDANEDADDTDPAIRWKKTPDCRYAILELPAAPNQATPVNLGEGGHVLATYLNPDRLFYQSDTAVHVWNPATGKWSERLADEPYALGCAYDVAADGQVFGVRLHATGQCGPSMVIIPGTWKVNRDGSYKPFESFWPLTTTRYSLDTAYCDQLGPYFLCFPPQNFRGLWYPVSAGQKRLMIAENGDFTLSDGTILEAAEPNLYYTDRPNPPPAVDYSLHTTGSGWASYSKLDWGEDAYPLYWEGHGYLLSPDNQKLPGPLEVPYSGDFTIIDSSQCKDGETVAVWLGEDAEYHSTFHIGTRTGNTGNFTWTASARPEAERPKGKLNARGEAFSGSSIWRNGKWHKLTDLLPANHGYSDFVVYDTNDSGEVLARASHFGQTVYLKLLPVRVEDNVFATGVDNVSCSSEITGIAIGKQERFWIMAPCDGPESWTNGNLTRLYTGLDQGKLTHSTPAIIADPNPTSLSRSGSQITWSATGNESNDVFPMTSLYEGNTLQLPIGIKRMKHRTLKVMLHRIQLTDRDGGARPLDEDLLPSEAAIKQYLDEIFGFQLNVWSEVTYEKDASGNIATHTIDQRENPKKDENGEVLRDEAGNILYEDTSFTIDDDIEKLTADQSKALATAGNLDGTDIHLFVIANHVPFLIPSSSGGRGSAALGITDQPRRLCWVLGNKVMKYATPDDFNDVISHEIGHVMCGEGHPDEQIGGVADLGGLNGGTDVTQRLMCGGNHRKKSGSKLLVKAEWDAADAWLKTNIDDKNNK